MCPLCEGPCSFPWWQHLAVYSMGSGVSVQSLRVPLQLFLSCCFRSGVCQSSSTGMLLLIGCWDWCSCGFIVSCVWVSSRSLSWGGIVWVRCIACECGTWCMCHVEVISGVFLAFIMWWWEEKRLSCLFYHNNGFEMGVTGVLVPFDLDFGVEFSAEDFDFFTCTLDFLSNHLPFFNFFPYSKWLFSSEESS